LLLELYCNDRIGEKQFPVIITPQKPPVSAIKSTSLYRLTNQGKERKYKGLLTPEGLILGMDQATSMDELNYDAWMSETTMMNYKLQLSD